MSEQDRSLSGHPSGKWNQSSSAGKADQGDVLTNSNELALPSSILQQTVTKSECFRMRDFSPRPLRTPQSLVWMLFYAE
jgi:hypothetical protein